MIYSRGWNSIDSPNLLNSIAIEPGFTVTPRIDSRRSSCRVRYRQFFLSPSSVLAMTTGWLAYPKLTTRE